MVILPWLFSQNTDLTDWIQRPKNQKRASCSPAAERDTQLKSIRDALELKVGSARFARSRRTLALGRRVKSNARQSFAFACC